MQGWVKNDKDFSCGGKDHRLRRQWIVYNCHQIVCNCHLTLGSSKVSEKQNQFTELQETNRVHVSFLS